MWNYAKDDKMLNLEDQRSVELPEAFMPYSANLKRIGPNSDGGYWVETQSITTANCLLSFGMNDDWRFERALEPIIQGQIDIYDGSVSERHFRNNIIKEFLKVIRPKSAAQALLKYIDYYRFFRKSNVTHHEAYIGLDFENRRDQWLSLTSVLAQYDKSAKILIKCDIEGGEYRLLNEILLNSHRLTGLIIEFHDLDVMMTEVVEFLHKFPLKLVALNVNNYGTINEKTPTVVECTFSSQYKDKKINNPPQIKNDLNGFLPIFSQPR